MAYENVIQTVGKCGFGDSLLISTHSRVFTLFFGRPRAQFRPRVHLILEVSRSRTIRHTHTHAPGMTPLYKWSARRRCRYLRHTQQTQWTNIPYRVSKPYSQQPSRSTNRMGDC